MCTVFELWIHCCSLFGRLPADISGHDTAAVVLSVLLVAKGMKLLLSTTAIIDLEFSIDGHCVFKIYRRYGDVSRDRHFGGLITFESSG